MSDTITNPENITESAGLGDAITATASPRPWRVADIDHDYDILDADGKVAARAAHGNRELAALICDAVNLKARIDEAMADESGYLYPVVLDGKPMVCVTPPPSEAEESRMHREYETSLLADRERFRRCYYEAAERNDRLRDIVRRLAESLDTAMAAFRLLVDTYRVSPPDPEPLHDTLCGVDITELLREAREAIGEGK